MNVSKTGNVVTISRDEPGVIYLLGILRYSDEDNTFPELKALPSGGSISFGKDDTESNPGKIVDGIICIDPDSQGSFPLSILQKY